jgi:pilus assembly protein CpaC
MRTSKLLVVAQLGFASTALPAKAKPDPAEARSAPNASTNTQDSTGTDELDLAIGENKTVSAVDVKNYAEGVAGIADVKLTTDRSQFVVSGQKSGTTTLLLIKKDGSQQNWIISVHARAVDAVEREISQLLIGTTGLRMRRVGGRIFIDGGVSTEPELKRIQQVAALYPGQVESLVAVGAPAADRKIDIRIDFFFVQYDRTKSYAFGVSWPARLGGAGVATSQFSYDFLAHTTTTAQASVMNQPLPALDMAADNGWAKVLKQSTVISSNGNEATFSSGGEQNFPITSGLVAGIKEVLFGTNLTVLPRYDPQTRDLAVTVKADVSDLVAPAASSVIPGRTTTHLDTSVNLKLGQSLVLSGIRSRTQRHAITGIPILSEIPVLGVLFGSHSDASEDNEGAIFIIPSVIEHIPQANMELINHTLAEYEEFSGDMNKLHTYSRRPPIVSQPVEHAVSDSTRREK